MLFNYFWLAQQSYYAFFLFCVVFSSFFTIPTVIENATLKLGLAIPTDAPITLAKEAIDTPILVADKAIKDLSK